MRLIVCGGRDYQDRARVFSTLSRIHNKRSISCIIHGACTIDNELSGADRWAHEWAGINGVFIDPYPADWTAHGKAAGPIRNRLMLEKRPDGVAAFPGGKGTADMCKAAEEEGVNVMMVK